MESIDEQKARQVWQRVHGSGIPSIDPGVLTAWIAQESTDAAACIRLVKRLGGRGGELLQVARQCQQNAGCLRGICAIMTGKPPATAVPTPGEEPAQAVLKKCYVNSLNRAREYERFSQDPEYGPAFQKMTAAARDQCAVLLNLIGKLAT